MAYTNERDLREAVEQRGNKIMKLLGLTTTFQKRLQRAAMGTRDPDLYLTLDGLDRLAQTDYIPGHPEFGERARETIRRSLKKYQESVHNT